MAKWSRLFQRRPSEYQEYDTAQQDSALRFSRTYRRHFEDYTYRETTDRNGKIRMVRVYSGVYYSPAMSRRAHMLRKLLYTLFWLLCAGALAFSAGCELRLDLLRSGALVYGLAGLALLWMLGGLINYLITSIRRTAGEQRDSSDSLKKSTLAGTAAFAMCIVLNLVMLLAQRDQVPSRIFCVLACLAGLGISLLWNTVERKTVYRQSVPDETQSHTP